MTEISKLEGMKKCIPVSFVLCSMIISAFIHYRSANSWEVFDWNSKPVNVDAKPERVWDWQDIQFLRRIGRN